MNKKMGSIIAAVVIVIIVAALAIRPSGTMVSMTMTPTNNQQEATEVKSGSVTVDIKDFNFHTKKLRIKAGTKVTWSNRDDAKHDINPDTGNFEGSTKLLARGESYSYTFQMPGVYAYHCTPHPYMKASVEVIK